MYGYEIFHEDLMQSLIKSVHEGTSSHAYIFEGSKGLNIREAARLFAAALCCRDSDIAPCGACPSCLESKADTNPDIVYVVPDPDRKTIGTKVMRRVEEDAAIKPFAAARKVYIIDNAEIMTEAAQNVFLKTLEEPPSYAVFILIIENEDNFLQTIRSRAVTVHFPPVSDSAVREYIKNKYPNAEESLDFLVKYCAGVPLVADSVISDENFEPLRTAALEILPLLFSQNKADVFRIQEFTDKNKENFTLIEDFWLSFLRDALIIQQTDDSDIMNVDKKDALRKISGGQSPEKIMRVCEKLITAQRMSAKYVSVKGVTYWLAL